MTQLINETVETGKCPVDHTQLGWHKTHTQEEPQDRPIEISADGTWHIRDYETAKTILRGTHTKQAGFGAEIVQRISKGALKHDPVLFQEGAAHKKQRTEIARFFTPKATSTLHRRTMERYAHEMMAKLYRLEQAELRDLSLDMAVAVAAQIVGLTNSLLPGMGKRMNAFIDVNAVEMIEEFRWEPKVLLNHFRNQSNIMSFYYLDVLPAIQARKKRPQEDVISHLISQNYSNPEILVECITYGTAGMVTTREFIAAAGWHLLDNEPLRTRYVASKQAERYQILEEILRLEPVVGHLYRRANTPITLEHTAEKTVIPAGTLLDLHIYAINTDIEVAGENPEIVCPMRPLQKKALPPVMSFGDGHHRCPGAYVAIQESDIFLMKLLSVPEARLVSRPYVAMKDAIKGYEVQNCIVSVA